MAIATVTRTYQVPKDKVFAIFADIGTVSELSRYIVSSKTLNDTQGVGALRECNFDEKSGIHEEVTAFTENELIQFTGTKIWGNPMTAMIGTFKFTETSGTTTVEFSMDYELKGGWIVNQLAKPMNRKIMRKMLEGAAAKL